MQSNNTDSIRPNSSNIERVSAGDRQQILLDDLKAEIARLAEAIEKQNELLEEKQEAQQ